MSEPFFSVIIPAHNAEKHILRLLDSIASQTFRDYELIVICDNCTDNTEQIAKFYDAVTDRVSFGRDGLSRDRGIELARGEWILFADDDDWFIDDLCFQSLAECCRRNSDSDMIAFGYIFRTKGYVVPADNNIFTPRIAHVWSSCWKRSAVGDARFGDATFCSDTYFLRAMRSRVGKYTLWNMPIYYYNFMRTGSQTDLFVQGIIRQSPVAE